MRRRPGTYTVTVADVAGNTATSAFTFTADPTAPTGAITAPVAAANVRGAVAVTSSSADAGCGRRLGAVPDLTARRGNVVEPRCRRHHRAVHRELGHDRLRRRALRPARRHDRQGREHLHVGDHRQRPGRQHRAYGIDHRTRRERLRQPARASQCRQARPTPAPGSAPRSSRGHRTARAHGRTSERPTRTSPYGVTWNTTTLGRRPIRRAGRHHRQVREHLHLRCGPGRSAEHRADRDRDAAARRRRHRRQGRAG